MAVRLRQILDELRHRLLFLPLLFVALAMVLSEVTARLDRRIDDDDIFPGSLTTSVESARSILVAIAGGLITAITLLLSMMLVAVQLASSQLSPRTLRNWIGDRTQQAAIGLVLGTTVYCLLILRQLEATSDERSVAPNLSVLVAVVLGVGSLIAVVRSVDQLTNRLRIGSVASSILTDTVELIERRERVLPVEEPAEVPTDRDRRDDADDAPPDGAHPVIAGRSGWVQQIDIDRALEGVPEGSTLYLPMAVGGFVFPDAPVAWLWPKPADVEQAEESISGAVAIGETRTMQQDIGFGIVQMVDIAVRALSPGVNDPNTASDIVSHLGVTMLKLWERPVAPRHAEHAGRTVVRRDLDHAGFLHSAFDPIRLYGAKDPGVATAVIRTLQTLRTEVERRDLVGPIEPIDVAIAQMVAAVEATDLDDVDKQRVLDYVSS